MILNKEDLSLRASIAAAAMHEKHDPHETTVKARQVFLARFEAQVDPDNKLPPEERARRAKHARRAYFSRIAIKSVREQHLLDAGVTAEAVGIALDWLLRDVEAAEAEAWPSL